VSLRWVLTDQQLTHGIINAAIEVHPARGLGLPESVYEECLAQEPDLRHIPFERQKPLPVVYKGVHLDCGYRADLLVDGRVIVELKAVAALAPIHDAIVLTYLRLSSSKIGLLINFHIPVPKQGIRRPVLNYPEQDH
jgi:GxxExxY protein